jgi:hypothetical protein
MERRNPTTDAKQDSTRNRSIIDTWPLVHDHTRITTQPSQQACVYIKYKIT